MQALGKANEVRAERSRLLGGPKGQISPSRAAELLEDVPESLAAMSVEKFLRRVRGYGRGKRMTMTLSLLDVDPSTRLVEPSFYGAPRGMTEQQRRRLARRLRDGYPAMGGRYVSPPLQ